MRSIYGAIRLGYAVGLFIHFSTARLLMGQVNAADNPVFDIPRLNHITIDGDRADWGDHGLLVSVLHGLPPGSKRADGFDAVFRLGWDERGLLLMVGITDLPSEDEDAGITSRSGESIELFLAPTVGSDQLWKLTISPDGDSQHRRLRTYVTDHRTATAKKRPQPVIEVAQIEATEGRTIEALLPWDIFSTIPAPGSELAFQIRITRNVEAESPYRLTWYPTFGDDADGGPIQRIRLAEDSSPPVLAACTGGYEGLRRVRLRVATVSAAAEQHAQVRLDSKSVCTIPLEKSGRLSIGEATLPMPEIDKTYGPLEVWLDGKQIDTIVLPDATQLRREALNHVEMGFDSYVFSGKRFPKLRFKDPFLAEDLIGPFTLHTTYFDKDYNRATVPEQTGRYGAVVEIRSESGFVTKRFFTLYHHLQEVQWHATNMPLILSLPPELGVDPEVGAEQASTLSAYMQRQLVQSLGQRESASFFAWLHEVPAGSGLLPSRLGPSATNAAWLYGLKKKTGDLKPYRYLVHLPPLAGAKGSQRFPMILFLHGTEGRGDDLQKASRTGIAGIIRSEPDWAFNDRFIVVSPQCSGGWWETLQLRDVLDEVESKYPVDPDRVYLTGLSMGGFGSWTLAQAYPEHFAAVAPICGGGDPTDVARLKDLPIWAFHGAKDSTVPIEESYKMIEALRILHGRVRFTVYPDVGHIAWEPAYNDDRLYDWFLQQRRRHPTQVRSNIPGTQPSEQ